MKRVSIWDMDFYYKKSFSPNPLAMKLSSFHKQQGDLINFISEEYHITMSYDVYYIIKEKVNTPKPPGKLIDDKRVRLIGTPMRFFEHYWHPSPIISAVRPDYTLYPEKPRDPYYNANIAQFYHEGRLIEVRQPFDNAIAHHKKTLVIDKNFWDAKNEEIIFCLLELQNYKNIAFLHPINLKKIMESETIQNLFIDLHFSQGTIFRFRNNYGQEYEDALVLFDFIRRLKEKHRHVQFTNIPFKAVTKDHWESREDALIDLERSMKIIDKSKEMKILVRMVSPPQRTETPYWYYFEPLEFWTLQMPTMSYIEMMLFSAMKRSGLQWFQILNDERKWFTPNTYFLLKMLLKTDLVTKYGMRQWGDTFIDRKMIDIKELMKFKGSLNTENIMEEEEWRQLLDREEQVKHEN